jgi:hypothetical protein
MANNAPVHALGWDDEIVAAGGSFEPIDEGDYAYEVKGFEREWYNGSASGKIPPCPVAKVTVSLYVGGKHRQLTESMKLSSNLQWIIETFFQSCGLWPEEPDGIGRKMDFEGAIGLTGVCHVILEESDSKTYNHVSTWYRPSVGADKLASAIAESAAPAAPAAPDFSFAV